MVEIVWSKDGGHAVHWLAVHEVLTQHGFEVYVVNARDTRNLPGRCQRLL